MPRSTSRVAKRKYPTVADDPDFYLRGHERRIRREAWEWPESERHPAIGIVRRPYEDAWHAYVGNPSRPNYIQKYFWDSHYGGSTKDALEAAKLWRIEQVKKRFGKDYKPKGWKLGPEQAGNVQIDEERGFAKAVMIHDSARCQQSFHFKKYGRAHAIMLAELALEVWREEAKRISLMPRREQERIARRGGWTQRKGFPATREQMSLPLDG